VSSEGPVDHSTYLLAASCVGTAKVKFTLDLLPQERREQIVQCPGETHFIYKPPQYRPDYSVMADLVGPGAAHVSWKLFGKKNKVVGTN
jgi:hypothetical protein